MTIALIFATPRKVAAADRFALENRWHEQKYPLTRSNRGSKIGIIGMGNIGREVARLCTAFGTQIAYFGPNKKQVDYTFYAELEDLAEWTDVFVAACPGGKPTAGLVSGAVLDKLGSQDIFINIERGFVIDEQALVDRLVRGNLADAGLDVFADEPNIPEQLLNSTM